MPGQVVGVRFVGYTQSKRRFPAFADGLPAGGGFSVAGAGLASSGGGTTISIANGGVTLGMLAAGAALSVLGVTGNAVAQRADIVAAVDGDILRRVGNTVVFGSVFLAGSAAAPSVAIGDPSNGLYMLGAAGVTEAIGFTTNGAVVGNWSATGLRVGGATANAAISRLTVIGPNTSATDIQILMGSIDTDATQKFARFAALHYNSATEEPAAFVSMLCTSSDNLLRLGGGIGAMNAVTRLSCYAAANFNTVTGTELTRLTTAGLRVQTAGTMGDPSDTLHVYSGTLTADIFRCSDSLGNAAFGGAPVAFCKLNVISTTGGFATPRMTTTQRDAMTPFAGLEIYNTTLSKKQVYTTAWETVTSV